jgi:hypothetical protein
VFNFSVASSSFDKYKCEKTHEKSKEHALLRSETLGNCTSGLLEIFRLTPNWYWRPYGKSLESWETLSAMRTEYGCRDSPKKAQIKVEIS